MLKNKLIPASEKHSIIKTTFTVFFSNIITHPEEFKDLYQEKYKEKFQEFKTLVSQEATAKLDIDGIKIVEKGKFEYLGFLMKSFKDGKQDIVVRSARQVLKNKKEKSDFLVFECYNYDRWNNFRDLVISYLKDISEFRPGLIAEAFNLSYLDKFDWPLETFPDVKEIFNDCELIPLHFFQNKYPVSYELSFESDEYFENYSKDEEIDFGDRLKLSIKKNLNQEYFFSILLKHEVIFRFEKLDNLEKILIKENFINSLNKAHNHNKILLKKLLKEKVLEIINYKES